MGLSASQRRRLQEIAGEVREIVASRSSWEDFGPLLASQAWYRGFAAAERKVFVSDGSSSIEKMQQTHFSHYTSVLDILHALSYSLAAELTTCATAETRSFFAITRDLRKEGPHHDCRRVDTV